MINAKKILKYSKVGYGKLKNNLKIPLFLKTGFFLPKPEKAYYLITNKCNFQCKMCPQWIYGKDENPKDYISGERMREIIGEMKKIGIKEFGISGGEPLLFQKKLFFLLEYANKQGIYTNFTTNGFFLTEEILEKYNAIGGGHISLSIDGIEKTHDYLRSCEGAFKSVKKILELFKKGKYKNIVLKVNLVLSNDNIKDVEEVISLAINSKAVIFIQPYTPYDYGNQNVDEKEKKFPLWLQKSNHEIFRKMLDRVLELKNKYPNIILNDERHLNDFYPYFTSSDFYSPCYASFGHITITPYGKIGFCKFGSDLFDLNKNSLGDYIKGEKRKEIIAKSLKCRDSCLIGCMYRPCLKDFFINGPRQFLKLISN